MQKLICEDLDQAIVSVNEMLEDGWRVLQFSPIARPDRVTLVVLLEKWELPPVTDGTNPSTYLSEGSISIQLTEDEMSSLKAIELAQRLKVQSLIHQE